MPKILAVLTISAALLIMPSAALAVGVNPVASLDVLEGQLADGLAVGLSGDFYTAVSSPSTKRTVTRNSLGGTVTEEITTPSTGEIRRVTSTGEAAVFSVLPGGPLNGLVTGPQGRHLYVSLASKDPSTHGIWRVDLNSRAPELYVPLPTDVDPRGLAFRNNDLFVADGANGRIYKIGIARDIQIWSSHPLLKGRTGKLGATAIGFTRARVGAAITLGGTEVLQEFLYVGNSDAGRIVRIPIYPDASAGLPEEFTVSSLLEGVRGITFDGGPFGGSLIAAVASKDRLVAVSPAPDPKVTTVLEGNGLQSPVSVVLQSGAIYLVGSGTGAGANNPAARPTLSRLGDLVLPLPLG